jgi:serine/threonine protein kinase
VEGDIQTGTVLKGRYEIQRSLGGGSDKKVYLAHDRTLDCQVTLDVFLDSKSITPGGLTLNAWEARVLSKLSDHPSIATVLDSWNEGDRAFMATRYLSGGSLRDLIGQSQESGNGLPVDDILRIATEITGGLAHIHSCRILYRDLQPKNVLFDKFRHVRLVDFDTAMSLDDAGVSDLSHRSVIGCIAPELIDGTGADERADLYSLGVTIYEMCAGHPPFAGAREEVLAARNANLPPPLNRDDLPEGLRNLVFALLSPDREQRPASAGEVLGLLQGIRMARTVREATAQPAAHGQSLPAPDEAELRKPKTIKAADYDVGDVIDDRFEILAKLGGGGFSIVYHVRDDIEDAEWALKLFNHASRYDAVRREIGALRKIRHPNVVEVFWAAKTSVGDWYLITEFIRGELLQEVVDGKRPVRDREAVDIALDLLAALVAFHPDSVRLEELEEKDRAEGLSDFEADEFMELKDQGFVHRDIKPMNVMLTRTGAKLLDFNIASRVGDPVHTQSGTPPYQPPDVDYTRWDVSTDLFAVGVVLYQLLCEGQHPYPHAKPTLYEAVIDPRKMRRDLHPGLVAFLMTACAPARVDRFPTAARMQAALREIRDLL